MLINDASFTLWFKKNIILEPYDTGSSLSCTLCSNIEAEMNKLIVAIAALLAATLLSGNAFAFSGGHAKSVHASNATVKVSDVRGYAYAPRRHYRRIGCGCGHMIYTSCYTSCGSCGGGCGGGCGYGGGCGGCGGGCGGGLGGFPLLGWLF